MRLAGIERSDYRAIVLGKAFPSGVDNGVIEGVNSADIRPTNKLFEVGPVRYGITPEGIAAARHSLHAQERAAQRVVRHEPGIHDLGVTNDGGLIFSTPKDAGDNSPLAAARGKARAYLEEEVRNRVSAAESSDSGRDRFWLTDVGGHADDLASDARVREALAQRRAARISSNRS